MAKEERKLKNLPAKAKPGPGESARRQPAKKSNIIESGNKEGKLATPKQINKALAKATKPNTDKVASTKSKAGAAEKMIQNITNRYRVTAREARDIVTAVGTIGTISKGKYMNDKPEQLKKSAGNLVKQVKETAKAATTGTSGSRSGTAYPGTPTGYYEPKKKGK